MIDFYDNVYTIMDKVLGKKLLQRKTERGLYRLPVLSRLIILPDSKIISNISYESSISFSFFNSISIISSVNKQKFISNFKSRNFINLLHRRMRHPYFAIPKQILSLCNQTSQLNKNLISQFCDACKHGKSHG